MKNSDVEKRIKQAFDHAAPDIKDSVISRATSQKNDHFEVADKKYTFGNRKRMMRVISGIAAAAAVFCLIFGGAYYSSNLVAHATVSFDVNPSVELKVSKNQRVIDAVAKNDEGKLIIGDMDMKNIDIDVAVNALIGSMLRTGYISELANSILISVDGDEKTEEQLRTQIMEQVRQLLDNQNFNGAILSQNVNADGDLKALADKHGITVGKAQLISDIVGASQVYTFDSLVNLSINELNLIYKNNVRDNVSIEFSGEASDKSYIGEDKAVQIALDGLKISSDSVSKLKTELDFDDGLMVYEVEFVYGSVEYEYEINAVTGDIIEVETDDKKDGNYGDENEDKHDIKVSITEEQAKNIAFAHAGVDGDKVEKYRSELERDDGVNKYEIKFYVGTVEYKYDINAMTGTIIKFSAENDD